MKEVLRDINNHLRQQYDLLIDLDDRLRALESTVLFHFPQLEDDLAARLDEFHKASVGERQKIRTGHEALRRAISELPG
jgi:hypothetical protein